MEKRFYSLLLLLFISLPLLAQTNKADAYTLKGQVIDSLTNETVPYATLNIALTSNPQKPVKLLACDEDGKFETSLAATGNYVMIVQSVGKTPTTKTFAIVESKKTTDLGKVFMTEGNQRLSEVTVTAQKPLVKIDIDKITYSLEDDPEAQTNNTLDMLRKVPMVTVDGEDKIQLKGSENFKIYLNGKPSNMLSGNNASDVLKSMPASSVKNIEVITDPGAKYDAEGVGGIINITTTKNALQGYTGTINANASALGRMGGGAYLTTKIGKLGLTARYNYNYNNSPWTNYESFREQYGSSAKTEIEKGRNKNSGPFQFGTLEASYEIDSLNLLTVGGNLFNGRFKRKAESEAAMIPNVETLTPYSYSSRGTTEEVFGSTDLNIDYQHSTKKKDELLTISYRFSNSPNDSESETYLSNVIDYPQANRFPWWSINDAYTREHTAQIDYTTPLFKDHTLEAGVKYILRQNNSHTTERIQDEASGIWRDTIRDVNEFKHTQHIYSGYFAYGIKYKKYGFKAGVRAEGTALDVKYDINPALNFDNDYFDVVPNATVSYMINMAQQIRLGYNMRISRPGIWYLNPYINDMNPNNISYGNPNLNSEKSHGINANYSMFTPKFNFNANLTYRFVNNAIQRYTFLNSNGIYESTYDNMGKNQNVGLFLYGRWSPVKFFNISLNGGIDYVDMEGDFGLSNNGFNGRIFANGQFILPKDFNITLYGGYGSSQIRLQGKGSDFHFHGLSVNKSFINKKLTVSLSANSPFLKNREYKYTTEDATFYQESINNYRMRDFSIRVSYRFGTLKESIKKVRRGISNDDQKSGEGGGGGGESGGGQQG